MKLFGFSAETKKQPENISDSYKIFVINPDAHKLTILDSHKNVVATMDTQGTMFQDFGEVVKVFGPGANVETVDTEEIAYNIEEHFVHWFSDVETKKDEDGKVWVRPCDLTDLMMNILYHTQKHHPSVLASQIAGHELVSWLIAMIDGHFMDDEAEK